MISIVVVTQKEFIGLVISYSTFHTSCLVGTRIQTVCVAASWPVPASWSCWSCGSSCPMYKYYTGSHLTSSHSSWLQLYNVFYCTYSTKFLWDKTDESTHKNIDKESDEFVIINVYSKFMYSRYINLNGTWLPQLAHTWFLRIAFVQMSACMHVCPLLRLLIISGVIWNSHVWLIRSYSQL